MLFVAVLTPVSLASLAIIDIDLLYVRWWKSGRNLGCCFDSLVKLTLVLRSELLRVQQTDYIMLSKRIGNSALYRCRYDYLPMILSQWLVGTLLMFPHAILHSAALSFGFWFVST